jgi:Flp pilus assembly protein TadD
VDPIIRICSAVGLALALTPSTAVAKRDTPSALSAYVQGRMADASGQEAQAVAAYEVALSADPASLPVAIRAYRQAVEGGNKALALRAARTLDVQKALPPDGLLLLISESFAKADWAGAELQIDRMEEAGTFAFLTPVLRAWLTLGAARGDPLGPLSVRSGDGLSSTYAQEHRGILLLATKQIDGGISAIGAVRAAGLGDNRTLQLRLSAAQRLIDLKEKGAALKLLGGEDRLMTLAREQVSAGKPIANSVVRPATGMAMLLARVSNDLIRDNASPVSVTLARLATFADSSFVPASLVLARALGGVNDGDGAIAALALTKPNAVSAALADELRFDLMLTAERLETALTMAKARTDAPGATAYDAARVGEVLARMERPAEAATAYARAIDMMAGPNKDQPVPWNLWLLLGREYDLAKDWVRAKPALKRAVELGPDEPSALNHLGYSMLVNGESLTEATRLIEKASSLRPGDAAIADSLGFALLRAGQVDKAIPVLERAAQNEPAIAEISEHLGDAYWAAGRRVDARYAWSAALIQSDGDDAKRIAGKIDLGPK